MRKKEMVKHNVTEEYLQSLTEEQRIAEMKEWTAEEQARYLCPNGVMSIEEFRALGHQIIDEDSDLITISE